MLKQIKMKERQEKSPIQNAISEEPKKIQKELDKKLEEIIEGL